MMTLLSLKIYFTAEIVFAMLALLLTFLLLRSCIETICIVLQML